MTIKELTDDLLDSWDRQARIVASVAKLVTEDTRKALPSPDGWPLDKQLAHIHQVRRHWLSDFDPNRAAKLGRTFTDGWDTPIDDLAAINSHLNDSAAAVRAAVSDALSTAPSEKGPTRTRCCFSSTWFGTKAGTSALSSPGFGSPDTRPPRSGKNPTSGASGEPKSTKTNRASPCASPFRHARAGR